MKIGHFQYLLVFCDHKILVPERSFSREQKWKETQKTENNTKLKTEVLLVTKQCFYLPEEREGKKRRKESILALHVLAI